MPQVSQHWRIGVDTGGTFTDLVLADPLGTIRATHKRLSTPNNPGEAVLGGIAHLLSECADQHDETILPAIVHGSTVATNALLEDKGARAVIVTTEGFEDILAIARQNRPELYSLVPRRAAPKVGRAMTTGVCERVTSDGSVQTPLSREVLASAIQRIRGLNPESIALCLLHSYANPEHEAMVAKAVREVLPGVHLTVSHELLPEVREYERLATCVANAAVAPVMSRYLGELDQALGGHRLRIMGSAGGTLPARVVCDRPIETVVSGPAGGAIGAWAMAKSAGIDRAIGFDMGGTSTDLTLIEGTPTRTTHTEIAGLPIRLPMIDIHTVGAGGGSIAQRDAGGALRVGPESAGAVPGPACYGRQDPAKPVATVTDAHVVLGHLVDGRALGDSLQIQRAAAVGAVGRLAEELSLSLEQAAHGILRIADAAMARATKAISVQRGYDLRRFTLLAFGGAGGLHACRLAQTLGMTRVLIPRHGGLLSAVGMLAAPPRYQFARSVITSLSADHAGRYPDPKSIPAVQDAMQALASMSQEALARDGVSATDQTLTHRLDMRYAGQSHELSVDCNDGDSAALFVAEHERLYGYALPGRAIEIVTARVEAQGPAPSIHPGAVADLRPSDQTAMRYVPVMDDGGESQWACWPRASLAAGQVLSGPMIVEEYAATTIIPRGWSMEVLADGQLSVTR
ncbi:MAG: hydantoinase/oxoprolinase family protein [Phycisphaerales bacterium JB063]